MYLLLQPSQNSIGYGALLGWSGMIGLLAVVLQGFRRVGTPPNHLSGSEASWYETELNRWGGLHTALAIVITVVIGIHALVFISSLWALSLAIWLGATSMIALIVLNGSGVFTESKRKLAQFGSLKRLHVISMLLVIALSFLHIELLIGPGFARSFLAGAIGAFALVFAAYLIVNTYPASAPHLK